MCASVCCCMPNQRKPSLKRTTITVDRQLYQWAMEEARKRGINDFSTFVRTLIAAEKCRKKPSKTYEDSR